MMSIDDIRARLAGLEAKVDDTCRRLEELWQRVAKLWYGVIAGITVASVMGAGYIWYAKDAVNQLREVSQGLASLKTDTLLIKAEQVRQAKDGDRAWKLVQTLMKNPPKDDAQ
jgi:hypothetical protein